MCFLFYVISGWKSGLVTCLEKELGKQLNMIGCSLHHNELPFKAVFRELDGGTKGPSDFGGPLGKLCKEDIQDLPQADFVPIETSLSDIDSDVVKELSQDQRLLYEYTKGIAQGSVSPQFASHKIGPVVGSRWLTLAIRLMALYTRGTVAAEHSAALKDLVTYIVQIYSPCWFLIKADSKFHNQPHYTHFILKNLKHQTDKIQKIVQKNLKGNSFSLLPENFLYSLVRTKDKNIRNQGINKILTIRKSTSAKVRNIKIPAINFDAESWSEVIDFEKECTTEPALTRHVTDEEFEAALQAGIEVDSLKDLKLPSHSQSVERCVKLVTESSGLVYGIENRHKHINACVLSRIARPMFDSKGEYDTKSYDTVLSI